MTLGDVNQMWNNIRHTIREVAKESLSVIVGTTKAHMASKESWWLSDERGSPLSDRTRVEERYKEYKEANREAKKVVTYAKEKAYEEFYRRLDSKEGANDIYRIAKARVRRRDIDNVKFVKDDDGRTIVKEDEIRKRWEIYFSSLFIGGRLGQCSEI
ncbi:uncharacterized protein [Rutidosis leptorrhynchoides]|uniref:uncharacterized protein n=1 Tax=Rutidosis leptorrhynchoides TaxID=125765 RepID=UPI003A999C5A